MKKTYRFWIYPVLLIGFVLVVTIACNKDDDKNNDVPILTTDTISNISYTSAICGGILLLMKVNR